ncbi:MAG: HAD family hydrolase [Actinobacteria bacterium]|nr:HAD family hydrolase [Actinomycetota bacterium]
MAVDAVVFDWGGTLTPWHTIDVYESWLQTTGDPDTAVRLAEAENLLWAGSRDEQRSGTLSALLDSVGVPPTTELLRRYSDWWEPHTLTDPDVPVVFAALKTRGIRIGVLSNTIWTRAEHERIFERDGVLAAIDGAVYTSEIPWTKPHPEAFRAALDAVDVDDPARAVFVGDRLFDDIHGAKAVGMRAVLVPHSDIPPVQVGPHIGEPDAVVDRLVDLVTIIDGWL